MATPRKKVLRYRYWKVSMSSTVDGHFTTPYTFTSYFKASRYAKEQRLTARWARVRVRRVSVWRFSPEGTP